MEKKLKSLRKRILINRIISCFSRALLVTSLLIFILFLFAKIASFELPFALLWLFLIPLVVSLYPVVKGCDISECAIYLDSKLDLSDRITTALETSPTHPMYHALLKDAESTLKQKDIASVYSIFIPKEVPVSLLLVGFLFVLLSTPVTIFGLYDNHSNYVKDKKNEAINLFQLALIKVENAEQKKLLEKWMEKLQDAKLPEEILEIIKKFLNDSQISSLSKNPDIKGAISDLKDGLEGLGAHLSSKIGPSAKLFFNPPENITTIQKELVNDKSKPLDYTTKPLPPLLNTNIQHTEADLISNVNSHLFSMEGVFIPLEYKGIILVYKKFLTENEQ